MPDPLTIVISGPKRTEKAAVRAAIGLGFRQLEDHAGHHWNLPSYPNTEAATHGGKPNSGHSPNTGHPDTGEAYEHDDRVGFLTFSSDERKGRSELLGTVDQALRNSGWHLRTHWTKTLNLVPMIDGHGLSRPSIEARLQAIEERLSHGS